MTINLSKQVDQVSNRLQQKALLECLLKTLQKHYDIFDTNCNTKNIFDVEHMIH